MSALNVNNEQMCPNIVNASVIAEHIHGLFKSRSFNLIFPEEVSYWWELVGRSLGFERLEQGCERFEISCNGFRQGWAPMRKNVASLFLTAMGDVHVSDVQRLLDDINAQEMEQLLPELQSFKGIVSSRELSGMQLDRVIKFLKVRNPFYKTPRVEEILGKPTPLHAKFFYDPQREIEERQTLMDQLPRLDKDYAFDELMTKAVVNRLMRPGLYILYSAGLYYQVSERIITEGGMVAYLLMPATDEMNAFLDPTIVFQGSLNFPSGLGAASTFYTDMEVELGKSAYLSGREQLEASLPPERKVRVIGQSLGGTLAQWFTVEHPSSVKELVTFNAPGLPKDVVAGFNEAKGWEHLRMNIFRTKDDFIDKAGDRHLGYGLQGVPGIEVSLYEFIPEDGVAYHPHQGRFLDGSINAYEMKQWAPSEVDSQLDNNVRSWLEFVRKTACGYVVAPIASIVCSVSRRIFGSRTMSKV